MIFAMLGCATPVVECSVATSEISVDDVVVQASDDGDNATSRVTPADILATMAGPSRVDAMTLGGASLPVTVSVAQGDGDIELEDATPDGCGAEMVTIPVVLDVQSDDGQVAVSATTVLVQETPAGTYWIYLDAEVPEADAVPAGVHGAAESANVSVTWGDGVVTQLSVRVLTTGGTRETVLWFGG